MQRPGALPAFSKKNTKQVLSGYNSIVLQSNTTITTHFPTTSGLIILNPDQRGSPCTDVVLDIS
jgi:hypothetical protein